MSDLDSGTGHPRAARERAVRVAELIATEPGLPAPAAAGASGPGHTPGRRRRVPRLVRRVLLTALSFTTLLVATALGLAGFAYTHYNGQIHRVAVLNPQDGNIRDAAAQVGAQNFLLIGSDTRGGADAQYGADVEGARSDTTILVHLAENLNHVTVVSFPRDSWVHIPACTDPSGKTLAAHDGMFNAAFTEGGAACTVSLVQQLTGIAVTHYVQVDFVGFKSMVNALGSVSICSPQAVADPGSGLVLQPGMNQLNGDQALAYVRARESIGDGSDLGRIKRQQLFLGAVLRQAMSAHLLSDPSRLTSFLDAATKAVTVDTETSFQDLHTLASAMQGLDPARVTFYTAPIADPNYTPPGTDQTGRVLLDDAAGRVLYDSIINDVALPTPAAASSPAAGAATPSSSAPSTSGTSGTAAGPSAATTGVTSSAPSTSAPAGLSGADTTCRI